MPFVEPPEHGVEIMVDLETLGVNSFSVILSIGAVRFEAGPMQAMEPFYQSIKLESALACGLKIDPSTLVWWLGQGKEARQVFTDPEAVALPIALDAFTDWYNSRPDRLWGNSASFDLGLLANAYKACQKELPWKFYNERCYRTLKGLPIAKDVTMPKRVGTHHNALDDAITQAHHCRAILKAMAGRQPQTAAVQAGQPAVKPLYVLDPGSTFADGS
jgi:hypothetical protein